jgi:hypothetical protein
MNKDIKAYDIEVDEEGDLLFRNGDFNTAVANDEHVKAILYSEEGDWKQFPNLGIGIQKYLNGELPNNITSTIKSQLQLDNFAVDSIKLEKIGITKNNIYIKARRLR